MFMNCTRSEEFMIEIKHYAKLFFNEETGREIWT